MRWTPTLSALAAVLLAGCSDRVTTSTDMVFDPQGPPADQTFTAIQQQVFDVSCAVSGCHGDAEYPELSAGRAYASIVGQPSTMRLKLVAPGQPDSSYLYIKIAGGSRMVGSRMPYGRPAMSDAAIASVRAWIERGAPND
jgi:hypothetical protein